uniref:Uncharacterized protein n=1 Tax=Kalanchoe fedtschenkoi TaxID=63787 RepID=A0A7N0T8P3_KALFE
MVLVGKSDRVNLVFEHRRQILHAAVLGVCLDVLSSLGRLKASLWSPLIKTQPINSISTVLFPFYPR